MSGNSKSKNKICTYSKVYICILTRPHNKPRGHTRIMRQYYCDISSAPH